MISKFFDYVKLNLESGKGGAGGVSFRREKREPMGGPDGGDGGRGGHIILKADGQINTFAHLYGQRHFKAQNGLPGSGKRCHGSDGENTIIRVPVGTVVKTLEGVMIHELNGTGEEFIFLKGGIGGKGNYHFRSSTHQKPIYSQKGIEGEMAEVILELKLIADVGLVGFPNAGKSTLLTVLTKARPKIANYPFTTLKPELGVYEFASYETITIADIPGIIEGAHKGEGLGIDFLRHIERTASLIYLIDAMSEDHVKDFQQLRFEMKQHSVNLEKKPFQIVINKMDLISDDDKNDFQKEIKSKFAGLKELKKAEMKNEILFFSSLTREGLDGVKKVFEVILVAKKELALKK